jgi:hypothetical protein
MTGAYTPNEARDLLVEEVGRGSWTESVFLTPTLRVADLIALCSKPGAITVRELGIPEWFLSDGCTKAPDWPQVWPACGVHDFGYWLGGPADDATEFAFWRKLYDWALKVIANHNAYYWYDGRETGWWSRTKRWWVARGYWAAVRAFGRRSFRKRPEGRLDPRWDDLEDFAIREGRWSSSGPWRAA